MKNPLLIIIAAVVGLGVILVWVYLMFFNKNITPENIFNSFGNEGEEVLPPENPNQTNTNAVNLDRDQLRQLTTRPVAGFKEVKTNASSTPELYYVEMGTGHIYSINTETGEEKRLSGTTIAQAKEATISPDGKYAAIASINNTKNKQLIVGKFNEDGSGFLDEVFVEKVSDFNFGEDNEVLFTKPESKGLVGYLYNLETNTKSEIFTIPFYEAKIQWGKTSSSTHYLYPKSSFALTGYLYEVTDGKLNRLPLSGYGFSALVEEKNILYTKIVDGESTTFLYNLETGESKELGIDVLIDKCIIRTLGNTFLCPRDRSANLPKETPDTWYKGELSFKDALWELDTNNPPGGFLFDTIDTGRDIDIVKLANSTDFESLYFTNKNDNSLWMYEIY